MKARYASGRIQEQLCEPDAHQVSGTRQQEQDGEGDGWSTGPQVLTGESVEDEPSQARLPDEKHIVEVAAIVETDKEEEIVEGHHPHHAIEQTEDQLADSDVSGETGERPQSQGNTPAVGGCHPQEGHIGLIGRRQRKNEGPRRQGSGGMGQRHTGLHVPPLLLGTDEEVNLIEGRIVDFEQQSLTRGGQAEPEPVRVTARGQVGHHVAHRLVLGQQGFIKS